VAFEDDIPKNVKPKKLFRVAVDFKV